MAELQNRPPFRANYMSRIAVPDKRYINSAAPGMGDVNVMVKPSSLKDKTPMCLVNELARYNRIQHLYRLTKEEGPPHRKKFTVTLKLGDTEFEAQGTSIKKAQHEAAAIALRKTKYKHPPPKLLPNTRVNTTPTVELNALAMKRGEPTMYTVLSQPSANFYQPPYPINYYSRSIYQTSGTMYNDYGFNEYAAAAVMNGYSYPRNQFGNVRFKGPAPYKICLKVGNREYIGEGHSAQMARHNAAKKALEDLKGCVDSTAGKPTAGFTTPTSQNNEHSADEAKSPISAVHEKAFRHNLQATFEVVDEKGPPHMRTFVTECRVGDKFKTVGEGNGKKISKRRAAEKMIELLESLPCPQKPYMNIDKKKLRKRITLNKKKTRIIREGVKPNETDESDKRSESNPTTRLLEYQKKKHGKEPVYILVEEKGRGRKKQFSIEVQIDDFKCTGNGSNKKDAKRQASEKMLQLLGLEATPKEKPSPKPAENTNDNDNQSSTANSTPKHMVNGKQIAPGLLLVPNANLSNKQNSKKSPSSNATDTKLTNGNAASYDQSSPSTPKYPAGNNKHKFFANMNIQKNIAKEQLNRLADTFGYEVEFSDFPKGRHHREYLSLVTLNTNPPQTCYGSGDSTESAQNEAAFNALSMITDMGIENIFTKKCSSGSSSSSFIPDNEIKT
ncbi:double-stranded RNA-binding protein Staufen homolog [Planococcus citri]|uniref:double-stranded RNA-binding protein Staufen homolog n=1 Tax=Planococcus citri TaxID=170843 RepID=UPI0031F7DAC7